MRKVLITALGVLCALAFADLALSAEIPAEGEKCTGTLDLDGKTYPLKYAVAYACKVFDGEEAVSVLFSEAPIPMDKLRTTLREKGNGDGLFHFKPHVNVTFDKSGKPMFCNAWADNYSMGVSGGALAGKLSSKDGKARGEVSLVPDADSKKKNGFKVESFDLALLVVPQEKPEPKAESKDGVEKPEASKDDVAPSPAAISVKKLPLPDGATDVQYKKLVEQITCKSPADLKRTAEEMTKKLADQGWKTEASDVVSAASAILRRKRGDATLTVFVKPPAAKESGSTLMIMSKGLEWDEKKS